MSEEERAFLDEIFGGPDSPALVRLQIKLARARLTSSRKWILTGSLLTNAVGAFEVVLAGVKTQDLVLHPATLGSEKEFRLADLRRFDSIEDAEDEAIAHRVDDFLRGSLQDWTTWFDNRTGLNCGSYAIDWDTLAEVFQRRHVIVHNAGCASHSYLSHVSGSAGTVKLGQRLPVTDEYLERAIDELDALGTLLTVGAWAKWEPDSETTAMAMLQDRTYESMLRDRWLVASKLAEIGRKVTSEKLTEDGRLIFRCNSWLSEKRLHGLDCVKKEIEDWDTSALDPTYRLVQAALLNDLDAAFAYAHQCIATGALTAVAFLEWPMFAELREDDRFDDLLAKADTNGSASKPES